MLLNIEERGMRYNYFRRCPECNDGKQLGQKAVCPIHKKATFKMSIVFIWDPKVVFVDPGMA